MNTTQGAISEDLARVLGLESEAAVYALRTHAPGPAGSLPLTDDMLRNWSSGDLFGLTQNAGMGWDPAALGRKEYLILISQVSFDRRHRSQCAGLAEYNQALAKGGSHYPHNTHTMPGSTSY